MNITIDAEELLKSIDWASKVSKTGHTIIDLCNDGYVIFRAEGDLGMRSTRVQMSSDSDIDNKITYAVSSPHLAKAYAALTAKKADGPVTLEFNDDRNDVLFKYGYLHFPVAIITGTTGTLRTDAEKFAEIGSVDYNDFMDALRTANKATGSQRGATSMLDITFDYDDAVVKIMGTNKFTLVNTTVPFEKYGEGDDPRFLLLPDITSFKVDSERITIEESDDSVKFIFDNGQVATSRKQAAKKLNWEGIKTKALDETARKDEKIFSVSAADLNSSARIAISLTDPTETQKVVVLAVEDNKMAIASNGEGSPSDKIATRTDVIGTTIMKFPYDELKKALSAVTAERVAIRYAGDALPVIFESVLPDGKPDPAIFIMTRTAKVA